MQQEFEFKVSIITAVLNGEKYIEESIKSAINQSYKNIEIIVIDGGSTDRTLEIVNNYKNFISKIISEPDKGVYDAFNKGVKNSSGDLIYFLNSDDYFYDLNIIQDVVKIFSENKSLNAVYGQVLVLNIEKNRFFKMGGLLTSQYLKKGGSCPHQGLFVRRELFEKVGFFNEKFKIAGDVDFVFRCEKKGYFKDFFYYDRIVALVRTGGISFNPKNTLLLTMENFKVILNHYGFKNSIKYLCKRFPFLIRNYIKLIYLHLNK